MRYWTGQSIRPGRLLVEDVCCSWWLLALARRRSVARSGFTPPRPRVGGPELRSPRVDVWDEAVQFLLVGDRARQLAKRHPLTADGCSSCARPGCVAARMAVAAMELLNLDPQTGWVLERRVNEESAS